MVQALETRQKFHLNKFPDLQFEIELWESGFLLVGGVDEAGRGALAGPVVAAVLVLPVNKNLCRILDGVRDSKVMTPLARQVWAERIKEIALGYAIGYASNQEIDTIGILPATHLAVERAIGGLTPYPDYLLTDYLKLSQVKLPQTSLVKGDARCLSIAGASILAKTSRDECMLQIEHEYPGYGFGNNKGYGTRSHRRSMLELGLTPVHRRSFRFSIDDL